MTLTQKLIKKQKELDFSDARFADYLRVSRQLWSFTRGGLKPGYKILVGSLRAFPDLTSDVLREMIDQREEVAA